MEKAYEEIIPLHKNEVIFVEHMKSVIVRQVKGTNQPETLMGQPNTLRFR